MEYRTNIPWKSKIAALLKGEWRKIGILDLAQLSIATGGIVAGIFFISPELAALMEIRDRLDPALELEDRVFVKRIQLSGETTELELSKLRTGEQLTYAVWLCGGAGLQRMSYFGSGVLGLEESTVALSTKAAEGLNVALLQISAGTVEFTKIERWDVRRAVRESATVRMDGTLACDEVDENAV